MDKRTVILLNGGGQAPFFNFSSDQLDFLKNITMM